MTEDDIEEFAYQAGHFFLIKFGTASASMDWLRNFAEKVAAAEAEKHKWDIHSCGPTCERYVCAARRKAVEAEREACAKLCDEIANDYDGSPAGTGADNCAAAIRARG